MVLFWFRRDLRLADNRGLFEALNSGDIVSPVFIFDSRILKELKEKNDARVSFIYDLVTKIKADLQQRGSDLRVEYGEPLEVFKKIFKSDRISSVYVNEDYEPYARERDEQVKKFCRSRGADYKSFTDQVIFSPDEVKTGSDTSYSVYTPYKNKWLAQFSIKKLQGFSSESCLGALAKVVSPQEMPSLEFLGFVRSEITVPDWQWSSKKIRDYARDRDFPSLEGGTHLGPHLRFGVLGPRQVLRQTHSLSAVWVSELIWREFFTQVLWHHPRVVHENYRKNFDHIPWRSFKKSPDFLKAQEDFELWKRGETGIPFVDAGMRQLNQTGTMHNRVRMIVASFLTKHLLIHWSWGESYFAKKLLDFDLSSNNGNWQWCAGTGCDAAPFFRIFNPMEQQKKFDSNFEYIRKWIPEYGTLAYSQPMVDLGEARRRCLAALAGLAPS